MHSSETDRINDLVKLAMHRLAARALGEDVMLVSKARMALARMEDRLGHAPYMDEWNEILRLPPAEIRKMVTSRSQRMDRLRNSSPFLAIFEGKVDFRDPDLRRQLWRLAKRVHTLRSGRDTAWSPNQSAA